MSYRFQLRRGSSAEWSAQNPVLHDGEPGVESDTDKMKVGDGITAWDDLPYIVTGEGGAGTPGPIGPAGPIGPQGIQGIPGTAGAAGGQGIQGPQGIQGVKGDKGDQGDPGAGGGVAAWADITGKPATFPPSAHAASHQDGGADEFSVAGLSGVLLDAQKPIIGAGAADAVAGNDPRLTDARVPTAHTHPAADISDSTAAGRTLLTAADVAAQKTALALNNVTNTSDANKPVSTAQQTALDLKANLASPALTGVPTAPTAATATNTTQLATTAFVRAEVAALVSAAPGALDTLDELAAALGDDPNFAASTATALGLKAPLASPTFTGVVTVPDASLTLAKLSKVATGSVLYRKTAGAGPPEAQTLATLKTDLALAKADVGLGNVDNTSDVNKPVSTAQQTALDLKAPLNAPTFTGVVTVPNASFALTKLANMASGSVIYRKTAGAGAPEEQTLATLKTDLALAKADVGLGNVDNTSDVNKPVSTAQQTALNLKADLSVVPKHVTKQSTAVALAANTTVNLPLLDIAVLANEVWTLDYMIPFTVSGGVAGLKPIFTLPAGATGQMSGQGTVASISATSFSYSTTPGTAMTVAFGTASFTGYIYVRATITIGATAGNIRIGMATGASAAGSLLIGCSVLATKQ